MTGILRTPWDASLDWLNPGKQSRASSPSNTQAKRYWIGDEDPGSATDGDEGPGEPGAGPTYGVLNVTSSPLLVPAAFVAENLKWYSVFAVRPAVTDAETVTGLDPDPGSAEQGALDP